MLVTLYLHVIFKSAEHIATSTKKTSPGEIALVLGAKMREAPSTDALRWTVKF